MRSYYELAGVFVLFVLLGLAGCAPNRWPDTRGEYPYSRGAGVADEHVGIFLLHYAPAHVHFIRSKDSPSLEPDYFDQSPRGGSGYWWVRLPPGRYEVAWRDSMRGTGSGTLSVEIEAGRIYEFAQESCIWACHWRGQPNRSDVWVDDLTSGETVSEKQSYYWD